MESSLHKMRTNTLRAQLALCEQICRSLAAEYASDNLTEAQKAAIVDRWNVTTMERHEIRLMLESQESAIEEELLVKTSA